MKRLISLVVLLAAAPSLFAGATYKFRSVTTGAATGTFDGTVKTEGSNFRVEVKTGDGVLFKNGSIVLSGDAGKTLLVTEPATKSYYQLDLTDLLGGAASVTRQFGDLVKFEVRNSKVDFKDAGDGGVLEGFPSKRSSIDSSYDLTANALGQNMTLTMKNETEVWWTEKLPAEYTNFLQVRAVRTGIEAIDKMLEAQTANVKGFPLKQVTTTTVTMNGRPMRSTTTSTVSAVKQAKFDAAQFKIPAGYTRVENPIEKMMKRFDTK